MTTKTGSDRLHRTRRRAESALAVLILALGMAVECRPVQAQELEPRAYANTPVGMSFLLAGIGYSHGGLLFDPSLPIQGAEARVNSGLLGYVHAFGVGGMSAKFGLLFPYAALDAAGYVNGSYQSRRVTGFADPTLMFSINFLGAPAITLDRLSRYRQDIIVGTTLKVTAPYGQYDADRLLNIGTHRWSFKPELGISKAIGAWIVEGSAAITWFTTNQDFFGGQTLQQDPIYSAQAHVVYNFPRGLWLALDATYYTGGRSSTNGVPSDNSLDNWRTGLTLAVPVDRNNSIKFSGSTGISTRTGTDFTQYLLAWQYRWGGGL
jgi:hypothetical protein